jgi:hypothetical protein
MHLGAHGIEAGSEARVHEGQRGIDREHDALGMHTARIRPYTERPVLLDGEDAHAGHDPRPRVDRRLCQAVAEPRGVQHAVSGTKPAARERPKARPLFHFVRAPQLAGVDERPRTPE